MARPLTLAYSPCPNDTFIFAALAKGLLNGTTPEVRVQLDDIAALNSAAQRGVYDLTKVSYGAIPELTAHYNILRAGGALGRGCGPLIVTRNEAIASLGDLDGRLVAIPGERTTALILLRLATKTRPQTLLLRYDKIVDAVAEGVVDAGLIIHESRFTYQERGLKRVADLGEWWEAQTNLPIPLGAVLIRSDLAEEFGDTANAAIRASLAYARTHEEQIMPYVREHATDLHDDVVRRHIDLYVNEFSDDLGDEGMRAVKELFRRAHEARIVPRSVSPEFV